jgi:hypothetical protein
VDFPTVRQQNASQPAISDKEIGRLTLLDTQSIAAADQILHGGAVKRPIGLCAGTSDGRSLAAVENPELDAGPVGRPPHEAIQGIDLANEVALPQSADGRVAGHLTDRREPVGEKNRVGAESGRGGSRLRARMPSSDDNNVRSHDLGPYVSRETSGPQSMFHVKHG